jgi:hypothetical protein
LLGKPVDLKTLLSAVENALRNICGMVEKTRRRGDAEGADLWLRNHRGDRHAGHAADRQGAIEERVSPQEARQDHSYDADRCQIGGQPQHRDVKVVAEHEHQQVAFGHGYRGRWRSTPAARWRDWKVEFNFRAPPAHPGVAFLLANGEQVRAVSTLAMKVQALGGLLRLLAAV